MLACRHGSGRLLGGQTLALPDGIRQIGVIDFFEAGFVIEQIHLRRSPVHEEVNQPLGLGRAWESRHRSALRALSDRFEVRAVCEQVAVRAEQAAREFNAVAVYVPNFFGERAYDFYIDADFVVAGENLTRKFEPVVG